MKYNHWQTSDMVGKASAWAVTGLFTAVCLLILLTVWMMGKGAISLDFLFTEPNPSVMNNENAGGILTPLVGTLLLTCTGILVAFPIALSTATYIAFYGKEGILTKSIELAIDVLSGVPTIVIALFSLAVFTNPMLVFLSTPVQNNGAIMEKAYGRSFLVAGVAMAIMILPFMVKAMTESLRTVPKTYMDGAIALGADKWRAICEVAYPASRRGLISGTVLGMGRIMGDTAIVWLSLGGTLRMTGPQPWYQPSHWLDTLRNTGSTLTSYIYYASPAGEGNNIDAAFGASLVLIIMIVVLNAVVAMLGNMKSEGGAS